MTIDTCEIEPCDWDVIESAQERSKKYIEPNYNYD